VVEVTNKTLILIPTYNEKENAGKLCSDILALGLNLDILFIDDNSPDGTGKILDGLAEKHSNITLIHRRGKLGIGSAHHAGIKWAYGRGYKTLITMDCDFTHLPEYIPMIIENAGDNDVVVGSRYMQEKSLEGWNMLRKCMTNLGHFMTSTLLRMPYDATGAFRLYRLNKIPEAAFDLVGSQGYSFFFESLYVLRENGFRIKEMSVRLPSRTCGHSKMRYSDAWQSFKLLVAIYIRSLMDKNSFKLAKRSSKETSQERDGSRNKKGL
jgi:dolichol-phosphate mannosyltransferase